MKIIRVVVPMLDCVRHRPISFNETVDSEHLFSLATLFSDINRIDFNGKPDEIENLKQSLNDFLKKVVAEMSQIQEQD